MSKTFGVEAFAGAVEKRHDELRRWMASDKTVTKNIKRGAAAISGEYARLEAIYEEDGDIWIPHDEKAHLFELAVDLAACCLCLTEQTVQKSRQSKLEEPPEAEEDSS